MSEETHSIPIPEEPDILIQDLEDIPDSPLPPERPTGPVCARCDTPVPQGETYCDDCTAKMGAYPMRPLAWLGGAAGVVVCLLSLFLLATNILIARPVLRGDKAMRQDDLRSCYAGYADSYNIAARLNELLFPNASVTLFTNGSRTLEKQILATHALNGPYQAGRAIDSFFPDSTPESLQDIYAQYKTICAFVEDMQRSFSDYRDTLEAGETGDYVTMIDLVEEGARRNPQTPDYMILYYRFSVSYSLGDDTARTCKLLDELIAAQPDALWLYASEGIRAYDLDAQYDKALNICNCLMQRDASNTASIAYTIAQLRLLRHFDDALAIYDNALPLTEPSSEMERQRAIVLMLRGDCEQALDILVKSYNPETSNLEHVATIAVCAYLCDDPETYAEYKTLLDSYMPFAQVDSLAAGDITLEDIFLSGGGEIR